MKEIFIEVPGEEVKLETKLWGFEEDVAAEGNKFAVISHPHPQYGGSQENNVVFACKDAFSELGIPCVTFNFRGVGESTGSYSNGIGEINDLIHIVKEVSQNILPDRSVILVGYSFGAIITLAALKSLQKNDKVKDLEKITLISYPFEFMPHISPDYENSIEIRFLHGTGDSLAEFSVFQKHYDKFKGTKSKKIIQNADHFYFGFEETIKKEIMEFYSIF